ncbi:MAG: 30S ribosomal protein S12 methylthiotransferase RimO [Treponema sp.]|jgi:ribosomal protein S12 methylthiotransferase|nr:30S ribosomal protein S12 methylthiotransferase RimO [Treponema sp.]
MGRAMRYFLDPFGCAKNQVDGETIMAALDDSGWACCAGAEDADLIIVNSCGFIEAAKRESINAVLAWRKRYPQKKILLAGCLAQRYGKELAEELQEADGIFGNRDLPAAAWTAASLMGQGSGVKTAPAGILIPGRRPLLGFPGSAYVKISEGCNNCCSFCAIPLIRGPLLCRSIPDVASECGQLLERGVKELCLIGQDLASYSPPGKEDRSSSGLAALLTALAKMPGSFWVRLLYLHPDHFPADILPVLQGDSRLLPYFDIPFQHASRPLLARMNRRGDAETYLRLLENIRAVLPGAVFRSTFLTGFPGETDEDLARLLDFQERARFDWLGVFTYSREEGTAAWSMKDRVPKKTAAFRKRLIEERQIPITEERMNRFTGQTMDVLIEEAMSPSLAEGLWLGRLFCQAPEVDGAAVIRHNGPPDLSGEFPGNLEPGMLISGRVTARAGFDLEVKV